MLSFGPEVKILVYAGAYLASLVAIWVLAYNSGSRAGRQSGVEDIEKHAIANDHGTYTVDNDQLKFSWKK